MSKISIVPFREQPGYQRSRQAVILAVQKLIAHWIVYLMRVYDRLDKQL